MRLLRRIDENGFFVEDVLISDECSLTDDIIDVPCREGFYLPRWNGAGWEEGLSQAEIDAINSVTPEQTTDEKLEELATNVNDALLAIMMLSIE